MLLALPECRVDKLVVLCYNVTMTTFGTLPEIQIGSPVVPYSVTWTTCDTLPEF